MTHYERLTRGETNCNPGNIDRNAIQWQGMAPVQKDPRFVVFVEPLYGIRAIGKVLLSYQEKHKLRTVRQIINRWAPSSENNTDAYIEHVAERMGVGPDDPIDVHDPDTMEVLVRAIIKHENDRVIYDDALIVKAVDMALA